MRYENYPRWENAHLRSTLSTLSTLSRVVSIFALFLTDSVVREHRLESEAIR